MGDRPLAVSAATGGVSSLLLWLLKEGLSAGPGFHPPPFVDCPICEDWDLPKLDFWCGVLIGLAVWPALELLVLAKQWATLALRNRVATVAGGGKLYRVLE